MIEKQNVIIEKFERTSDLALPPGLSAPPSLRLSVSPSLRLSPALALLLLLLFALVLGSLLATLATLPLKWMGIGCVGLCGLFGIVLWWAASWPFAPALRFMLLVSCSFKLQGTLFGFEDRRNDPRGITISIMLIVSVMLAAAYFGQLWRVGRSDRVFPAAFSLALGALFLWCAASIAYGENIWLGISSLWVLASWGLMCFAVAWSFSDRRALQQTVFGMAAAVGLSCVIGLLQHQFDLLTDLPMLGAGPEEDWTTISGGEIRRVYGFLWHANLLAMFLVCYAPVMLAMLILPVRDFSRRKRGILLGVSGLSIIVLILTYSRGSWMAFAAASILLAMLAYLTLSGAERRRFTLRITVAVMLIGCLCLPFADSIHTRLTEDDQGAAQVRLPLMEVALEMIRQNPLLGVGLNGYQNNSRRYDHTAEFVSDAFDRPVHNVFLHIGAEIGVPGLLCFLVLIVIALQQGWKAFRSSDDLFIRAMAAGLITAMVAYLLTGLKESGSLGDIHMRLCFLLLGLLIAVGRVSRRAAERYQQPDHAVIAVRRTIDNPTESQG